MYESPIDIIYSNMQMKLENEVFKAIQNVGINVDKDELIKALSYDRQQYKKGYADAKAGQHWIPVSERLPEPNERVNNVPKFYLVQNKYGDMYVARYCNNLNGDAWWEQIYYFGKTGSDSIVAYMELPEPYREGGEDD